MKIGFIIPQEPLLRNKYYLKAKAVMEEDYPRHKLVCLFYDNYIEAPELLKGRQETLDAVIFGGAGPMEYTAERLPQKTIWSCIPKSSSALLRALMEAKQRGWNLDRISFDSYSREFLQEVYGEINRAKSDICEFLTTGIISHEVSQNESTLNFHTHNYRSKAVDGCITVLFWVNKALTQKQIPNMLAYPTKNTIRQQIHVVEQLYRARKSLSGNMAICLISLDLPKEYSLAMADGYQFMVERTNILKQIYRFSEQVKGTVVELSTRESAVISTRNIVEIATETYHTWELLDWMYSNSVYTISVGVGYGETVADAKENAGRALLKAMSQEKNAAYVVLDSEEVYGPFLGKKDVSPGKTAGRDPYLDAKLLKVAEMSNLSVETVYKLHSFVQNRQNRYFISSELATFLNISKRSADRILERLERHGYATVTGRRMHKGSGRPMRVLLLDLNSDRNVESVE